MLRLLLRVPAAAFSAAQFASEVEILSSTQVSSNRRTAMPVLTHRSCKEPDKPSAERVEPCFDRSELETNHEK
jgi:hypothetical protein